MIGMERDYIVTSGSGPRTAWAFQVYESQLQKRLIKYGDNFKIVVICDRGEAEVKFEIPYSDLKSYLQKATRDRKGRYLFEVNKTTLMFNWHHSIKMDGQKFLESKKNIEDARKDVEELTDVSTLHLAVDIEDIEETRKDIKEQEELLPEIEKKSREQIIEELRAVTHSTSEEVDYKGKRYKRDNQTLAQLKKLRGFKCQICGDSILKKNGGRYIEASHITPKREKGSETPDNILILCPNHHKEFDLGNKKIVERTKDRVVFELNGKRHGISLEIK